MDGNGHGTQRTIVRCVCVSSGCCMLLHALRCWKRVAGWRGCQTERPSVAAFPRFSIFFFARILFSVLTGRFGEADRASRGGVRPCARRCPAAETQRSLKCSSALLRSDGTSCTLACGPTLGSRSSEVEAQKVISSPTLCADTRLASRSAESNSLCPSWLQYSS